MDSTFKLFQVLVVFSLFASSNTATARMLGVKSSTSTLAARLKLEEVEGSSNCWDSLLQLQSCTAEVLLFFLNGKTYLGPGCCRAIKVIEHECWPSMLSSIGYTAEEGDILLGYCDASFAVPPLPPPKKIH